MNIKNLLVALVVVLTQLHTAVAQTPTPPNTRVGPPQFAHGTKLMYASTATFNDNSLRVIPDGSILKGITFYYYCTGSLLTRVPTGGVTFTLTMTLRAEPFEGEQAAYPSDPSDPGYNDTFVYVTLPTVVYTESVVEFVRDRKIRGLSTSEMTVTLDLYKSSYSVSLAEDSTAPAGHYCATRQVRFAYLPPIVGLNTYLPGAAK